MVAAMIRVSTFLVLLSPTRSNSPSCRTRSSLTWSFGEVLLISSRKMLPACAASNRPVRLSTRAGERALDVPEQLALQQALGQRAAVDPDVRAGRPRAQVVDGPGDQLLARAGLADDQDAGARRRDPARGAHHLLQGRAAADDARQGGHRRRSRRPRLVVCPGMPGIVLKSSGMGSRPSRWINA